MATTKTDGRFSRSSTDGYAKALAVAITQTTMLLTLRAYSKSASQYYLQIHDAASTPTDLTTMIHQVPLDKSSPSGDEYPSSGLPFYLGIQLIVSTSETAVTAPATDDVNIVAVHTTKKFV